MSKLVYLSLGIPTPSWFFKGNYFGLNKDNNSLGILYKPRFGGSKIGIKKVGLAENVSDAIFEDIIGGKLEVSVSVLKDKEKTIVLEPIARHREFDNIGKVSETVEILNKEVRDRCMTYARLIFDSLGCYGVTKTDFLIDDLGKIWVLETDAIPGLSVKNATVIAAQKSGIAYVDLINKILNTTC
jgi:D-alanine-D-alanine ligase